MEKSQTSGAGASRSRSALALESTPVDLNSMSQSELYSRSVFDLQSTNITGSVATPPSRIFAFSHRRNPRYRRRVSASKRKDKDPDPELEEDRRILNSLEKLIAENMDKEENNKRKRESNGSGLGVIKVKGEEIDLDFLARAADEEFEARLTRLTEGMVTEDELLGFLSGLKGRWGSTRKRRRYVDAADLVKALPSDWKILLSLRPRIRQRSLYCRRFVSPSGVDFESCKDVAFYLKSHGDEEGVSVPGAQVELDLVVKEVSKLKSGW